METNSSGLKLHTSVTPGPTPPSTPGKVRWKLVKKPKVRGEKTREPTVTQYSSSRAPVGERLLRNTSVACALILTVMAMRAIDTPFTNRITSTLSNVLSTDLNLDESVGKLSFVENLMPDSALVFFHMGGNSTPMTPVAGSVSHGWTEAQPWTEYITENGADVISLIDGTVSAASKSTEGDWTVLITRNGGSQLVYAFLNDCKLKAGQTVSKGDVIGTTGKDEGARLYLEYRVDSEPVNPDLIPEAEAS